MAAKSEDPRRKAYEREVRRRFGGGKVLIVAQDAIDGFRLRFKMPTWEAWRAAAALMRKHGKEPTTAEIGRALTAIKQAAPGTGAERERAAGALYCVLEALGAWSLGSAGDTFRVNLTVFVRDWINALQGDPREEAALAYRVVYASEGLLGKGTYGRFMVADARVIHGVALLKLPEADAREEGRRLLEEQVAEMERLLAGTLEFAGTPGFGEKVRHVCEELHAMAVNNLAQAWEQRAEGDRVQNLRRAIEVYERCSALPARIAAPEKLLLSLHHLALSLRHLAKEVIDPVEKGQLLRTSLAVAERGLELPRLHPSESYPMLDPLRLNHANTTARWVLHQRHVGGLSEEDADEELRRLGATTLEWLKISSIRGSKEALSGMAFFAQFLESVTEGDDARRRAISALMILNQEIFVAGERNQRRFLTADEARVALSAMTTLTPEGVPLPDVTQSMEVASSLPLIMGAVHPLHAGVVVSRLLYAIERAWLGLLLRRLGPLGRQYIDDAMKGMHLWMCEPDLPSAHRRIFAAQIGFLAQLARSPEEGLDDLEAIDHVRFHDLAGAAFYRAESTFYGQGETREVVTQFEPGWRINLYRARQEMDWCATLHVYEELRPALEEGEYSSDLDQLLADLRTYHHVTPQGVVRQQLGEPLEQISEIRKEINRSRRYGRQMGWSPAYVETTPAPVREEIAVWLQEHPSTAVLLTGALRLEIAYFSAGAVTLRPLVADRDGRLPAMLDRMGRVTTSWEALLGICEDEDRAFADLGHELSALIDDRGWRDLADEIATVIGEQGIRTVVVLGRGLWRPFPWECLRVGDSTLAERVRIVHLPTLSSVGVKSALLRSGVFSYVGAPEGSTALDSGRASIAATGKVAMGPLSRDAFEAACVGAGVLRVFAHGTFSKVDAPLSGLVLDEATDADMPYQGYEITTMDLRGCGRVELWACESGVQEDFLGLLLGNDEPLGIASSFLLAGARAIVGSIWKQPAMAAALIAIAFAHRSGSPGSAEKDAADLATAIRAYREVVDEDGIFERTLRLSLGASLLESDADRGHVARAMQSAWNAAASYLAGGRNAELPWSAVKDFEGVDGHFLADAREVVGDREELDHELIRCARRLTEELRSPAAWAGWRVLARDKSVL